MTPAEYLKEIIRVIPEISRQSGYSPCYLYRRFTCLYLAHRVEIDEFRSLRLYEYTKRRCDEFLLWKESKRYADRLNAGMTKQELDTFEDKHLFNRTMDRFLGRPWLWLPEADDDAVGSFLRENEVFLVKPCVSTQGAGIVRCRAQDHTPDSLRKQFAGSFLLEGIIRQHPVLDAVNPSSVNTIRYIAARHGEAVRAIGAGLRVGGTGQFVDNFHHGGVAYPLDIGKGVVTGCGIDLSGDRILCHPATGYVMPGLQIPFWEEVTELVRQAAVIVPHVGYVGWDIAVTAEGPVLIEGNVHYPGNTVIQIDGPGPLSRLVGFIKEQSIV